MNWLTRKDKKQQIKTTVKAMTPAELEMRIETLAKKGWTEISRGTFQAPESTSLTVSHRGGARGMTKTSNQVIMSSTSERLWCKMLSPMPEQEQVAI